MYDKHIGGIRGEEDLYLHKKVQDVIHHLHATIMEQQHMASLWVDPDLVRRCTCELVIDSIRLATTLLAAEGSII